MKYIPTVKEPVKLKAVYKEAYGEDDYDYQHNLLEYLEFRLLDDAYKESIDEEGIALMSLMCEPSEELNAQIRHCLETNAPFEYPELPEGAIP